MTGNGNMALTTMSLRLEAANGSGFEEYRVHDGDIEVRQERQPYALSRGEGAWRRLSSGEIADQVCRKTAVAQWLLRRIGWRRLLLACSDENTLEIFGVSKAPVDFDAA